MPDKLIVRTSDRGTFRRCRELWNFTSKIRENWEYVPGVEALDFGTAIHAALEVYYDPDRWAEDRFIVQQEAVLAFATHMQDWRKRLKQAEQWFLMENTWYDHDKLGRGMLEHFFKWVPERDNFWEPIKVEVEFEVPIPVPEGFELPATFRRNADGNLEKLTDQNDWNVQPIVYQGRIDLIVKDTFTGKYWIIDHKTAGQFGGTEHYEIDTQASSYVWATKRVLGIDVAGVIFQELRKKAPEPPALLKSGKLSKNKSQSTTVELYKQAIRDNGLNMDEYAEFLDVLANSQQDYFRRIQVDRTQKELDIIERHILNEAIDMFNTPRIYPNPSKWNCNGCSFREACMMRQDGSDADHFLEYSLLFERRL